MNHSISQTATYFFNSLLAELESRVGKEGRRKFEKFLGEVAEDKDDDVIDVESK